MAQLQIRHGKKFQNCLGGLFLIGLIFVIIFFVGGNVSLLKQNILSWPRAKAEVISVDQKIVCDTPEKSGACYAIFFIKYLYEVNGNKYANQFEQEYATSYSSGKIFSVYYKSDNPRIAFPKEQIPTRLNLYFPLIFGLFIVISVVILWIKKFQR